MMESETNRKISAGEVIVLTSGEYSDYGITGYIVSLIDFDMGEAVDTFKQSISSDDYDYDTHSKFIAWLVATEKVVPVEHREIHIGSYGRLELD
jgi:hypothetical protein